jgi:hypothetical protein
MKNIVRSTFFVLMLAMLVLTACGPALTQAPAAQAPSAAKQADLYAAVPALDTAAEALPKTDAGQTTTNPQPGFVTVQTGPDALINAQPNHKIIKNGETRLLVENTDNAIDRVLQVVGDLGGYVVSSRSWYQPVNDQNYKYATISIGVPVDQFEAAIRRLRTLAVRVLDENASGEDVTSEYVDLESQLGNLQATRDRIRAFLVDAKTVEESLRINQELTNIEGQIEQVKGRMNYLANRSAFSTITIQLEPDIPPLTPAPTPTLMPSPTPEPWQPGRTMHQAGNTIVSIYQGLAELAIWLIMVVIPLLGPPLLLAWGVYWLFKRRTKK